MNSLSKLKKICIADNIPIIRDATAKYIRDIILKKNYHSILEIGTAYGYSALYFSQIKTIDDILSIEKNEEYFKIIKNNINNKIIKFICADAFVCSIKKKFDFIFIDGPKSHQENLVDKYINNLKKNGTMIIDNIFLKKISTLKVLTKNQKKILQKIENFKKWLLNNPTLNVNIIDIDDGIAIITKKNG